MVTFHPGIRTQPPALYPDPELITGKINPAPLSPEGRPYYHDHHVYERDGMITDPGHLAGDIPSDGYVDRVFPGQPGIWRFPPDIHR